jgi:alkanesulfonate monooxygenase SsuD/methylene tetrahydromethanopterin reductase-like flavin-dependent oxidoreductase (luciferase family)
MWHTDGSATFSATEDIMRFGLLYEMETPRPWNERSEYNIYWQALEQIELADRVGFDYLWEVEHHFLEEYSHSSAPEVFFGAVSQRTKNIRIGHGVRLLPFNFNNPIKLAEQAAVLDIISNGRVEFGIGRSTTVQELDGFSIDYERTRDEVREAADIIVKAWTNEILEHDGKLMKIPPRRVVPKPIQKPHPPMWMACVAPDSYELAGDRGLGVLSFSMNFEQVQKAHAKYRTSLSRRSDQIPKFANEKFAALIVCNVAENKADEAIGIDGARWFMHHVGLLFTPLMAKNQLYTYEYTRVMFGTGKDPNDMTDAELKEHPMVVVGNPDEVIRKLEQIERAGIDQAICFKQAGRIPHANIMKSYELMGRHVLPHFNPQKAAAVS